MAAALRAVVAHVDEIDPSALADELIFDAQNKLDGSSPKAGIFFAAIDLPHATLLNRIHQIWPDMILIGCTTDGEFSSTGGMKHDSATLLLITSDTLEFTAGVIDQVNDVIPSGQQAFRQAAAKASTPPAAGILLADGLLFNVESMLDAAREAFGPSFLMVGGMAADQWRFKGTYQFYGTKILSRQAPFLLIHGDLALSTAIGTGWKAIGSHGVVTRAKRSVVYEIDNQPALDFFQKVLGKDVIPSNELPVAVYSPSDEFQYLRTCFEQVDLESGALIFAGRIPVGYKVRMTVVDRDSLIQGTFSAARQAMRSYPSAGPPALALCFSCSARRALLGSRTPEEAAAVQQILGQDVPMIGFYTYGEISPSQPQGISQVHNETFTLLLAG